MTKQRDRASFPDRRSVVAGSLGFVGASAAYLRPGTATTGEDWISLAPGAKVTIDRLQYEADCGPMPRAIQYNDRLGARTTIMAGNASSKDDPRTSERAELGGWPNAVPAKEAIWSAWSMKLEHGPWSTADWCILHQHYLIGGSPIVHLLKPDRTLNWIASDTRDPKKQNAVRHRQPIEQGVWLEFVETLRIDPSGNAGYWRSWLNGRQVVDFHGPVGGVGVRHCFPKFGIYRSVGRSPSSGKGSTSGKQSSETLVVRYANMRFGTDDLSALVANAPPPPAR